MDVYTPAGKEPPFWIVVFSRKTSVWWTRWLACGEYQHVKACAPAPELGIWIFFDPTLTKTRISVATVDSAQHLWADFTADADLIRIKRDPRGARFARLGFWCVPAIKHLRGRRSGALRPDTLFRHCVAHGGEVIRGQFVAKQSDSAA